MHTSISLTDWSASSLHGGIRLPLPSALARLRAYIANKSYGPRWFAGIVTVILFGFFLLRWIFAQDTGLPPMWRYRLLRDDNLPFGGIARRVHGFASVRAMLHSSVDTVLVAHPDWHGILAATTNIDEPLLEVPAIVTEAHEKQLVAALSSMPQLKNVVIHGVPPGTLQLAAALHRAKPSLRVSFVFHGAPSNLFHVPAESDLLQSMVAAAQRGEIYKLGWVKNGLAPIMAGMIGEGARSETVWNFPGLPLLVPEVRYSDKEGGSGTRHIGVLGSGLLMKNILSQVLAACMLPKVVVHVTEAPGAAYLSRCASPVVAHGFMPAPLFARVLSRMDLNMYVSISECMPMVVLESLALGVPALTSPTSLVYAADPELEAALVVTQFDNPSALQSAIIGALARRDELATRGRALLDWLHAKAGYEWAAFLERNGGAGDAGARRSTRRDLRVRGAADSSDEDSDGEETGEEAATAVSSRPLASPVAVRDWRAAAAIIPASLPYSPVAARDWRAAVAIIPASRHYNGRGGGSSDEDGDAAVAGPHLASPRRLHIAMGTYELAPVSAGGAGVVISALAFDMLAAGHEVTMLAYLDCPSARQWDGLARAQAARELNANRRGRGASSKSSAQRSGTVDGGISADEVPLRTICVPDLLAQSPEAKAELANMRRTGNLWWNRAREFAVAARLAYAEAPFDMLELFDYAGIGFELTRDRWKRRLAAWKGRDALPPILHFPRPDFVDHCDSRASTSISSEGGAKDGGDEYGAYLPLHVPIVVRAHGTLQLIDQYEGAATAQDAAILAAESWPVGTVLGGGADPSLPLRYDPSVDGQLGFAPGDDAQLSLMYRMEQWSLAAADVVLAQSPAMQDLYVRAYGLQPTRGRVLQGQPPMRRVLEPFRASTADLAEFKARVRQPLQAMATPDRPKWAGGATSSKRRRRLGEQQFSDDLPTVLVYGKLQVLKGTKTVVEALVQLAGVTDGSLPRFRVAFVGLDTPCPRHGRLVSECIHRALDSLVGDKGPLAGVEILPPVKRDEAPAFITGMALGPQQLLGAVLASELETFSMAIHELAFMGVPLVASSIPAYDAVGDRAPFRFAVGNATDLARAIAQLLLDDRARARAVSLPPVDYEDPLAPYQKVAHMASQGGRKTDIGAASVGPLQLQLVDAAVRRACAAAEPA